eukprot:XP_015570851.1 uncharacterized protein LOC107260789 [Ricinus communis]
MENNAGRSLFGRPPFLNGTDYTDYMYWKVKMRVFIKAMDYDMWMMIEDGPHHPTKTVDSREVDKDKDQWDEDDKRLIRLEATAMHVLYCALDDNAFASVFECDSAKAIWDKLEVLHEGNTRAKEMKISMLEEDYEQFKMKTYESINEMFTRFMHITNALNSLGRTYTDVELVNKFLRSLSKSWKPKVTQIRETKDLSRTSIHELVGFLVAHEMLIKRGDKEEQMVLFGCPQASQEHKTYF